MSMALFDGFESEAKEEELREREGGREIVGMGRPPCCDKVGIKKGPWTPEEDIILVSYIQEHGPGNWRSVPTNTGLLRCSKSCRLRWTNYLRPGIKRGNFTPHEEGMIIHLQALLGNKWAAIASYLPQRTDNDIKNYWNTHLKKKIKKFQSAVEPLVVSPDSTTCHQFVSKTYDASNLKLNQTSSTYASSTENISRLLQGWMRSSPKSRNPITSTNTSDNGNAALKKAAQNDSDMETPFQCYRPKTEQEGDNFFPHEEFESILSFENLSGGVAWEKSSYDNNEADEKKQKSENEPPQLSFIEKWLLDETAAGQVEEMMQQLSPILS